MGGFNQNERDPDLTEDGFKASRIAQRAEDGGKNAHTPPAKSPDFVRLGLPNKTKPAEGFEKDD